MTQSHLLKGLNLRCAENSGKLFTLETGKRKSRSEKFKLKTERYRTTSGEIFTIKIISLRIQVNTSLVH